MKRLLWLYALILGITFSSVGQEVDNFQHADGYTTGEWGKLGEVKEFGSGDQTMILLPGWGFDWTVFDGLIKNYEDDYKIYAITFPGFGSTAAPAMPEGDEAKYSNTNWTNGIINGITDLMNEKNIEKVILVSYFTYSNIIATRLALDYADKVDRVIIISGMAKFTSNQIPYEPSSLQGTNLLYRKYPCSSMVQDC